MSKNVTRLFEQFQPENYNLEIKIDKSAMSFSGKVVITGKKVGRPSKRLTFHQKELKITGAVVTKHDKKGETPIKISRINLQKTFNEVRLHSDDMIYPGKYTIALEFTGKITDAMNGLYPSRYKDDGKEKIIFGTQFESHHAREVFPCIDEPEAKATFDLSLTTDEKDVALSNTPVKSVESSEQKVASGLQTTTFETTPIMSTYLLAFVAGDLKYKEAKTKDGVVIRTYATPDKIEETDFALDVAVKTLEFYNQYFDIPYPLEKLDMVALPDFAAGAMENWGLVTYREHCLLVDPRNTSVPTKQYVAMVVAHELAHQWFGNLVTMRWWTDLWLNEGFASWIEYMAVDKIFPQWQMWTQFIADEQQVALRLDALDNTHPIRVPVHHPDEIRTIFDTISYAKGASAIHMLHDYLGPENFRDGLRHYLKKHSYKNTKTVDLWEALEEVSKKDVKDFMHAWTRQPGFPMVTASFEDSKATVSQQRFFLSKPSKIDKPLLWPIPLRGGNGLANAVLSTDSSSFSLTGNSDDYYINKTRSGFYRTTYDHKTTEKLANLISAGKITPLARLGLLSDSFEVAKAGYGSTEDALLLLSHYVDEDNAAVWDSMASAIGDVKSVMGNDEDIREAMKPFVRSIATKQFKRLGWQTKKDEVYFDTLLRSTILGLMSSSDDPDIIKHCQKLFQDSKSPEDIQPDIRGIVWGTVARHGGKKEFDTFVNWHNQSTNSEVRTSLASAITGFKDVDLTKKALAMVKTKDVRSQDAAYWIAYALMNRFGRDAAWQWLQHNWDWLGEILGTDLSFSRFPIYAARVFTGKKYMKQFKDFFEPKISPSLERSIKQGIEIIQWHTDWYDRDHALVLEFLKKQK